MVSLSLSSRVVRESSRSLTHGLRQKHTHTHAPGACPSDRYINLFGLTLLSVYIKIRQNVKSYIDYVKCGFVLTARVPVLWVMVMENEMGPWHNGSGCGTGPMTLPISRVSRPGSSTVDDVWMLSLRRGKDAS